MGAEFQCSVTGNVRYALPELRCTHHLVLTPTPLPEVTMAPHFILIDFENVQPKSLGALQGGQHQVRVFVGASQNRVPLELASALQAFGGDAKYIQITGNGSNALDFHIAFAIGQLCTKHPDARFTIVSRDTGFDPLIKHLAAQGTVCKRVASLGESGGTIAPSKRAIGKKVTASKPAVPAPAPAKTPTKAPNSANAPATITIPAEANLAAATARLINLKAGRPRTLKTLSSSLKSWFKPVLTDAAVQVLLDQLSSDGKITIDGNKVTYTLS